MYPVTIEGIDGTCWSLQPPCYGFMKRGAAGRTSYSMAKGFGYASTAAVNIKPAEAVPFNTLKYIWNTGTHCLNAGVRENPDYDPMLSTSARNLRYLPTPPEEYQFSWKTDVAKDYLVHAARELNINLPDVVDDDNSWDYIDELKTIEAYFDAESDSIIRRSSYHRQIFGVQVDNNVPADRALNYLMLARLFTTSLQAARAYLYARYTKGLTPSQAAIFCRLVGADTDWSGNMVWHFTANSSDNCIYPCYLITCGIGSNYAEPTQVLWRQQCYSEMTDVYHAGHLRESAMARLRVRSAQNGSISQTLGGMLMAIFSVPSACQWWKPISLALFELVANAENQAEFNRRYPVHVSTSDYSQPTANVMYHLNNNAIANYCREHNTDLGSLVIDLMNTPFVQPTTEASA